MVKVCALLTDHHYLIVKRTCRRLITPLLHRIIRVWSALYHGFLLCDILLDQDERRLHLANLIFLLSAFI
jgi:hypothetical protein